MVMAEKSFPQQVVQDVKELFQKPKAPVESGKPGSELPVLGKCGCHPGGIHPVVEVEVAEQRDVKLTAIPVEVRDIVNTRIVPAKRGSFETFYPAATAALLSAGNGLVQGADPRLRRLIVAVSTQACWFGTQEALKALSVANSATGSSGVFLAPVGMYTWEGIHEDLWAMAATAGSVVSVRREYWTDI